MSLLEIRGLSVDVGSPRLSLLRDVSLDLDRGEILGLVGESGSGKTMLSLAVSGLLPDNIVLRSGSVRLSDRELVKAGRGVQRTSRDISLIFQDPRAALNPTMRVGDQIARVLAVNQKLPRAAAWRSALETLGWVRIPDPHRVAQAYPHQLSGGMCQRISIGMALGCRPQVLIADEPTTALDVTVQAQIFALIRELVAESGCSVLFITHDLGAIAEMCDRVAVIYGGQLMEIAPVVEIFERPRHPYTRYLLEAAHQEMAPVAADGGVDMMLPGCRFAHQCPHAWEQCSKVPPVIEVGETHYSSCWLHAEGRP